MSLRILVSNSLFKKYMEKDNVDRGKKTIIHAFRLLMFSIQIVEKGKVVNYHETLKYTNDMKNHYDNDWPYYQNIYEPVFLSLRKKLDSLISN